MSTIENKKSSLINQASTVSGATAFSRVLGLLREQAMAYFFGASLVTDAFVTAFRIPNLLRDMFAEGALSSAFVPVFKSSLTADDRSGAYDVADRVITLVLLLVGAIVLLGIIAAPAIVYIVAKGFSDDPTKFALTVSLTRLMFGYLLLVSLSAVVMGMLNSFGRFGIPALAPAMFNIGMIFSIAMLYKYFDVPIYAAAIGVMIGGVGQLVVQLPLLFRIGYRWKPSLDFFHEGVKKVARLFGPMVIGLSASRINIVISTLLASFLVEGSISYLNYSYRIMHLPLGMFAVALGTVSLPKASELAANDDVEGLGRLFWNSISLNMFVIMPSALFLWFFAGDIISLIYQHGSFGEAESRNTALALMHYSYGLIGFAAVRVTVPLFYAMGDSKLPTRISIGIIALNILLYIPLMKALGFAGLASATSIAGLANFALLMFFLPRRGIKAPIGRTVSNMVRTFVAAAIAFYVARMLPVPFIDGANLPDFVKELIILFSRGLGGLIVYLFLSWVMVVEGLWQLLKREHAEN